MASKKNFETSMVNEELKLIKNKIKFGGYSVHVRDAQKVGQFYRVLRDVYDEKCVKLKNVYHCVKCEEVLKWDSSKGTTPLDRHANECDPLVAKEAATIDTVAVVETPPPTTIAVIEPPTTTVAQQSTSTTTINAVQQHSSAQVNFLVNVQPPQVPGGKEDDDKWHTSMIIEYCSPQILIQLI